MVLCMVLCVALLCYAGLVFWLLRCRQIDIALLIDITLSFRRRSDRLLSRHGGRGRGRVYYSEWAVWNLTKEQLDL